MAPERVGHRLCLDASSTLMTSLCLRLFFTESLALNLKTCGTLTIKVIVLGDESVLLISTPQVVFYWDCVNCD